MKILLVCDTTYYTSSGGKVSRYLTKILTGNDNQVELVVISEERDDTPWDSFYQENKVSFIPQRSKKWYDIRNLLFQTRGLKHFKQILKRFKPEVVHFASFDSGKPYEFIIEAKRNGARVVLQPWIMDFFCAQGYGFRDGKTCSLCADGNYFYALKYNCISYKYVFSLIKRKYLQKTAVLADSFLSSHSDMDHFLIRYGINESKILRFPVPFDYAATTVPMPNGIKDYFIYYGQPVKVKGIDFLLELFRSHVLQKLRIYPAGKTLENLKDANNIKVVNNVTWSTGLGQAIADAKGVLMPTRWSSTMEYAVYEAMLFKKPLVLFNIGAHKELFINGMNAFLVELNDFESYGSCVELLDNDEQLGKSIGENAHTTLVKVNNPEVLYLQLQNAYKADIN